MVLTQDGNGNQTYSYAPTIIKDGQYRMYWCTFNTNWPNDAPDVGGGDTIGYATAPALDVAWSTPRLGVLPQAPRGAWDHGYTCDPSVVRQASSLYLYYGGITPGGKNAIGVARSDDDGQTWYRLNGGNPIITPATTHDAAGYGAGQPSALFLDGWFYIIFVDTTGRAPANPASGSGYYVMRSLDPTFQTNTQELTGPGTFTPYSAATHTTYHLGAFDAFSPEWRYIDTNQTFALAINAGPEIDVHFLTHDLSGELPGSPAIVPVTMPIDGAGIVALPDGHAAPSTTCGQFPIDMAQAEGDPSNPSSWSIWHISTSISTGLTCSQINLGQVYEGTQLSSSGMPLAVVIGATRINFALAAPANRIARNNYSVSNEIFNDIPYEATVNAGNQVLGAQSRPGAFLLDDGKLWPTNCIGEVQDNNSVITMVSDAQFDSHPMSQPFWCLSL